MTTIVGYVDVTYADEYVKMHFVTTDALRLSWEGLDVLDKEVLLRRSFEALETLPFTGKKYCIGQPTAFPRWPNKEVPEAIKAAQVENAIALASSEATEDAAFYEKLWQYGVDSYSIGNLSEHVGSGSWGRGSPAAHGVISTKASTLIRPYISGSYSIGGIRYGKND